METTNAIRVSIGATVTSLRPIGSIERTVPRKRLVVRIIEPQLSFAEVAAASSAHKTDALVVRAATNSCMSTL